MPTNIDKTYELRELQADDLFVVINIVRKIGINEFKACFQSEEVKAAILNMAKHTDEGEDESADDSADDSADVVSIGVSVAFNIASILLANIGKCKDDIYALLANLSGLKVKDIAKLPAKTFMCMVTDLVKKKEFADFFQEATKFLK